MRLIFVLIMSLSLTSVGHAQSRQSNENRIETQILTLVTIDHVNYVVRWFVALLANPSEPEAFMQCKAEVRDALISSVIREAQNSQKIDVIQSSLKTGCTRNPVAFEARPLDIRAD